MKNLCFFGAWDPAYPRNRILREGARRAGFGVLETRVKSGRSAAGPRSWPSSRARAARPT